MREEVGGEIESVLQVEASYPMASLRDFGQPQVRDLFTAPEKSVVKRMTSWDERGEEERKIER